MLTWFSSSRMRAMPGEADALLLREALHLAEQLDVARGVAPAAAAGARRGDEPEPVVLPQRLGVHAGELGGDRDDEDRRRSSIRSRQRARRGSHAQRPARAVQLGPRVDLGRPRRRSASTASRASSDSALRHDDLHLGEQVAGRRSCP